jgi:uncharacterized protein YecE (DUF72 family)
MPEELDLFGTPEPAPTGFSSLDLPRYRKQLSQLARQGIYVGTSSWKYPGWRGLIYNEQRYLWHSKFSEAKFNKTCLAEYAETYSTVCVDAGYYQFPTEKYLAEMCAQVPDGFKFGFKVTDDITIKKFPGLPRFGARGGTMNPNFLNPEMFRRLFLGPCEAFRSKVGPLIFEFSTFHKHEFEHGRDFCAALDQFLGAIPRGWDYGIEIRNKTWLTPEYFDMLRSHGVTHVFNNWSRMPSIAEQLVIDGSDTADFMVSRFLLKPGRTYEQAVETFQPYEKIQELNEEARAAAKTFLERLLQKGRHGYVYVNNRLEGNAPLTIEEILRLLDFVPVEK